MNTKQQISSKKIALASLLVAVAVVGGTFSIPVFMAKCSPVQHLVNVISAMLLGPWYAVAMAFVASVLRILLGTGSILAFPGSMCGAFLAGLLVQLGKKEWFAYLGELVGTGLIGAVLSFPIATFFMGREVALFAFVVPFSISSLGGVVFGFFFLRVLKSTKVLDHWEEILDENEMKRSDKS